MLPRETQGSLGITHDQLRFAADCRENRCVKMCDHDCRNVPGRRREAERILIKAGRLINIAERPERMSEVQHGVYANIVAEPVGKTPVALAVIRHKSLLEMHPRAGIIASKPARR